MPFYLSGSEREVIVHYFDSVEGKNPIRFFF